jgi:chaperonin GroES
VTISVKEGDKVLFPKYTGTEIKFGNEDYIIMDFEKVLAVIS